MNKLTINNQDYTRKLLVDDSDLDVKIDEYDFTFSLLLDDTDELNKLRKLQMSEVLFYENDKLVVGGVLWDLSPNIISTKKDGKYVNMYKVECTTNSYNYLASKIVTNGGPADINVPDYSDISDKIYFDIQAPQFIQNVSLNQIILSNEETEIRDTNIRVRWNLYGGIEQYSYRIIFSKLDSTTYKDTGTVVSNAREENFVLADNTQYIMNIIVTDALGYSDNRTYQIKIPDIPNTLIIQRDTFPGLDSANGNQAGYMIEATQQGDKAYNVTHDDANNIKASYNSLDVIFTYPYPIRPHKATAKVKSRWMGGVNLKVFGSNDKKKWDFLGSEIIIEKNQDKVTFDLNTANSYKYLKVSGGNRLGWTEIYYLNFDTVSGSGIGINGDFTGVDEVGRTYSHRIQFRLESKKSTMIKVYNSNNQEMENGFEIVSMAGDTDYYVTLFPYELERGTYRIAAIGEDEKEGIITRSITIEHDKTVPVQTSDYIPVMNSVEEASFKLSGIKSHGEFWNITHDDTSELGLNTQDNKIGDKRNVVVEFPEPVYILYYFIRFKANTDGGRFIIYGSIDGNSYEIIDRDIYCFRQDVSMVSLKKVVKAGKAYKFIKLEAQDSSDNIVQYFNVSTYDVLQNKIMTRVRKRAVSIDSDITVIAPSNWTVYPYNKLDNVEVAWIVSKDIKQNGYRVQVYNANTLGLVWDSGKVYTEATNTQFNVKNFDRGTRYYIQVTVFFEENVDLNAAENIFYRYAQTYLKPKGILVSKRNIQTNLIIGEIADSDLDPKPYLADVLDYLAEKTKSNWNITMDKRFIVRTGRTIPKTLNNRFKEVEILTEDNEQKAVFDLSTATSGDDVVNRITVIGSDKHNVFDDEYINEDGKLQITVDNIEAQELMRQNGLGDGILEKIEENDKIETIEELKRYADEYVAKYGYGLQKVTFSTYSNIDFDPGDFIGLDFYSLGWNNMLCVVDSIKYELQTVSDSKYRMKKMIEGTLRKDNNPLPNWTEMFKRNNNENGSIGSNGGSNQGGLMSESIDIQMLEDVITDVIIEIK